MADKTIGSLRKATDLYDDSLLIAEQQGDAVSVTGALFKSFARDATKAFAEAADASAEAAVRAKDAAQSALQGVQDALDNLPEGDTLIINDLTTGGTSAALSAEMGKVLGQKSNRNLLHNWYFANPVNQRGETEYLTAYPPSYTIDRWKCMHPTLTVNTAESITLTSAIDYANFVQVIEHPERLSGRRVYLSFMYKSTVSSSYAQLSVNDTWTGHIQFAATERWEVVGGFIDLPDNLTSLTVGVSIMSGGNVEFKAVKLELGSTQTLAHQDADGNWVLNEIPDYGEELAKCQRYYWPSNMTFISKEKYSDVFLNCNVQFPVTMRAVPNVTIVSVSGTSGKLSDWASGADDVEAAVNASMLSNEGFNSIHTATSMIDSKTYAFKVVADANL